MAVQDVGMERSWTQALPPPHPAPLPGHSACQLHMEWCPLKRTADWLNYSCTSRVKAPCEMGREVGMWAHQSPAPRGDPQQRRISQVWASPREKVCAPCQASLSLDKHQRDGPPHACRKPLGLVSKAPEGCRGLHFPFQRTCCGLSYSGTQHKRHPIWLKNIRLLILEHQLVGWGTDETLPGDRGIGGRHYWTPPTCEHRWLHTDTESTHCPATASCCSTHPPPSWGKHTRGVTASSWPLAKAATCTQNLAHEKMLSNINYKGSTNQTPMRCHLTPIRIAVMKKRTNNNKCQQCWQEWRKGSPRTLLVGM